MREFPIETVRAQFPALALKNSEQERIYLDNLGGAFCASQNSDQIWNDAHAAMAVFLGAVANVEIC